ncbi:MULTISPECIES: hypothetical protein [unclassified Curtobacterium]|uniref:hypothetical protein n=1 Tax=unclassified Curtobacterium TaxID=257496 RepID=UPI0015E8C190|nr:MULTISPECIES: hypothetical protein [unclassified Curtobacterium]QZQ53639.1 hypothetical protein KZI27_00700 [Curtobacterium sp. TC1]QZQ55558.1 hypothetical protein KZI27_01425 [Curtobacterium sp. TC1]WIE74146.1 hypothetical protein DEJ14_018730 [Curtobacterium sp. MCJR17_020]
MITTYQPPYSPDAVTTHLPIGLTDSAVIASYVIRRIDDPTLLASPAGPRYADFFTEPAQ